MIVNRQRRMRLALQPLARFYERVRRELGFPEDSVTICFVSDPAMARMNRKFREKSGPTDVLSFPVQLTRTLRTASVRALKNRNAGGHEYVGDIAISPQTAKRHARRYSRPLHLELRVLILHGMIHLAGYDHETDNGEMMRLERRLRRRLGLR